MFTQYQKRSNFLSTVAVLKIISVTAIVTVVYTEKVQAKTSQEIAKIAQETTVQINPKGSSSPGGSGVIIAKKGNVYTVATVNHVVCDRIPRGENISCRDDITYTIRTHTGKVYALKVIERLQKSKQDPDLAIVTFESSENYPRATVGPSQNIVIASTIYAAGYPATFNKAGAERDFNFTTGSITGMVNNSSNGYSLGYDALTKVGMSGGPVYDTEGRLIALHGLADTTKGTESQTGGNLDGAKSGWNAGIPMQTLLQRWSSRPELLDETPPPAQSSSSNNTQQQSRRFYREAIVQQSQRNYQGAIENYTLAIEKDPTFVNNYNNRAKALSRIGQYERAIDDYTLVIKLDSSYAPAYLGRADARAALNDRDNAIADYTQAIEIDGTDPYAYNNRATLLYEKKDFQGAIADLEKAIPIFLAQGKNREYDVATENLEKAKKASNRQPRRNEPTLEASPTAKSTQFTFTSLYEYSSCLDDILLFYEGKLARQDNQVVLLYGDVIKIHKNKSQCIDSILTNYENQKLSRQDAYYMIALADYRGTNLLERVLYPPLGIRRRVAILLKFIYGIDKNDPEILELVEQETQTNPELSTDRDTSL